LREIKIPSYFRELAQGIAPPKIHVIYICCIGFFYWIISIIAITLFPEPYSIFLNDISDQGGFAANPNGFWIYDLGAIITGLLFFPHINFLKNWLPKIAPGHRYSQGTGHWAIFFAGILYTVHGIIIQDFGPIHRIIAYFIIIGIFVASIAYLRTAWKSPITEGSIGRRIFALLVSLPIIIMFTIMVILAFFFKIGVPVIFIYSFWEWLVLISAWIWILGYTILVSKVKLL
jgi:hypothetical protein